MIKRIPALVWSAVKGFALFWVDFVIGDSPDIAIGVAAIFGIALALRNAPVAAAFVVPGAGMLLLMLGVWHGRNR